MKEWNPIVRFSLQEEPNVFGTAIPEKISSVSYFIRDMHSLSGAACICKPKVLGKILRLYGEDFYILPVSFDEVVVMPCSVISCHQAMELLDMKNQISRFVSRDLILSNDVYLYKRETQTVEIAEAD